MLFFSAIYIFAGDAATFKDMGFSANGSQYFFGQYGKLDKYFTNYADIWCVDIDANNFVKNNCYHNNGNSSDKNTPSVDNFRILTNKNSATLYGVTPARSDQTLYIAEDEEKKGSDEIIFTDFEKTIRHGDTKEYHVNLLQNIKGHANSCQSSFIIRLQRADGANQIFGNASIRRKGVNDYKIIKIVYNEVTRGIVFIIEKQVIDDTGVNIRYMVETGTLNSSF